MEHILLYGSSSELSRMRVESIESLKTVNVFHNRISYLSCTCRDYYIQVGFDCGLIT